MIQITKIEFNDNQSTNHQTNGEVLLVSNAPKNLNMEHKQEDQLFRPGSFSHYKALSEKQAKYIKILESSNAALLESLQRLEVQLKEAQTKASQAI